MTSHETYMHHCLELAKLGSGHVAPNPMVGAVLVFKDKIIGEGYHKQYGKAHAEPNCIYSVNEKDRSLIERSTLYVSLEPCTHFGKTPPCADLIIQNKIPKVVIGCRDPFIEVNGKGIEKLEAAGVKVEVGVLEADCIEMNKRFFTYHIRKRPYIILKWAQTLDHKIAHADYKRLYITNEYTNRITHKWRSEEMAILVGTNTALQDDPELTTRLWTGENAIRLVIDKDLRLKGPLKLFNNKAPTVVFNLHKHTLPLEKITVAEMRKARVEYYQLAEDSSLIHQILLACYQLGIQSILVEGGAFLLQSFIDEEMWDEARVLTNEQLITGDGIPSPVLKDQHLIKHKEIFSDVIRLYKNKAAGQF